MCSWSPRPASRLPSSPTASSRGCSVSPTRAFSSRTSAPGATRSVSTVSCPLPLRFPVLLVFPPDSQMARTAEMERSSPPRPALRRAPTAVSAVSTPSASPSPTIALPSTRSARTARPPPPYPSGRERAATTEPCSSLRSVLAKLPPTSAVSRAFAACPRPVRLSPTCVPSTT